MAEDYVTVPELRTRLGIDPGDNSEDERLTAIASAASRAVDTAAGRRFALGTASEQRTFVAHGGRVLRLGPWSDISTLTGVTIELDEHGRGTWAAFTGWTAVERWGPDGTRWPTNQLVTRPGYCWPDVPELPTVRITGAIWGWPTLPKAIPEATYLVAGELWKLKDAPLGVEGYDALATSVAKSTPAAQLLHRYRHPSLLVGVG